MTSFFKKFKKSLPLVSTKNATYYNRENQIENLSDLKNVLEAAPEIKALKTSTDFTFNNIPLLNISQNLLITKFENPVFILDNDGEIKGHKVFFYRESIDYYRFLIQYHFIDGDFFFATNKISSVTILSDVDKQKIIDRINNKYLDQKSGDNKSLTIKIIDPNNSIIFTRDDVYFHINYLAGNKTTKALIDAYADYIDTQSLPAGFNETLEQYI